MLPFQLVTLTYVVRTEPATSYGYRPGAFTIVDYEISSSSREHKFAKRYTLTHMNQAEILKKSGASSSLPQSMNTVDGMLSTNRTCQNLVGERLAA